MVENTVIAYILLSTVVGALGTIYFKKGVQGISLLQIWKRKWFWYGGGLYILSSVFYLLALRQEMITVVYPLASVSYLWVALFSAHFLHEKVTVWNIGGVCGIVLGMILIGMGS